MKLLFRENSLYLGSRSITVWLVLLIWIQYLYLVQNISLFGRIQSSQTRDQPYSDTFYIMNHSRPLFLYFRLLNTVDRKKLSIYLQVCRWLDSNHRPLVSEVTALPTEAQPLHTVQWYFFPLQSKRAFSASVFQDSNFVVKQNFMISWLSHTAHFHSRKAPPS